jgi:hypothetical protein
MSEIVWHCKQERREEKLDERELLLREKEEEVGLERKALYAQADEAAASFVSLPLPKVQISLLHPFRFAHMFSVCTCPRTSC